MKLLDLAKKNLQEYISVREVLELIASTQQTPISYVAVFLISQNFDANISTYDVDRFFIVNSNDDFNWGVFPYTNSILSNLADNEIYKDAFTFSGNDLPENLENTYWKRKELYNLELIKNLSLDFYFRVQDIKIIAQHTSFDSKEFESKELFSDSDVKKLLKNGISSYMPGSAEKYNLIDDFVLSSLGFFECNFDNGFEIKRDDLEKLFFDNQIIIKGFNDFFPKSHQSNNKNIWDANYLNLQIDDIPDLEEKDIYSYIYEPANLQFESEQNQPESKKVPLFYLNDSFTLIEASSLISGDDPIKINRCINDTNFDQNFPDFSEAYNFVNSAICAGVLPKSVIPADQLKAYLKNKGKVILGFNDISLSQSNTFENFDKKSTLKLNISDELDSNFIRIFTAVEFFKKMSSLRYDEVIIHIKKIFNNLTLYTLDENLKPVTGYAFCVGACIDHLSSSLENADENIHMLNVARYSVDEYFWDKNEFFNNEDVISFDLSKKNYNLFLIASLLNPDDEHIFLNNSDINILQKIINNKAQEFNAYMQIEFDKLKNNDDLLIKNSDLEKLTEENENLKSQLMQSQEQITKLKTIQKTSDIPEELKGLKRINQLAQDRQGMARIIALSLWEEDKNILISEMADKVYIKMVDYCKDDLPETSNAVKKWIRPVATGESQKRGRPPNKSDT